MYYYAIVDVNYIVTDVVEEVEPVDETNWLPIDSYNMDLVGLWYDIETQTFSHVGNKYLIPLKIVDGAGSGLDADKLDGQEASAFAPVNHTHDYASTTHTHSDYAMVDHTHTGYASEGHTHTGYAPSNHTHTGYASTGHTHSEYAPSVHTHSDYLPLAGGYVYGNLEVANLIKLAGNQFGYTNGTTNMQFGSASIDTMINGKDDIFLQTRMNSRSIVPNANNSYQIGNSSLRFKSIYLTSAPNVSSDRRLKENVEEVDAEKMLEFIDKLNVVDYNFIDDPDTPRIGLIAQDVEEAGGDEFIEVGEDGMYGLKTADLVYPLISTCQALYSRILKLEAEVEALKK